jgi:hypothetical protein
VAGLRTPANDWLAGIGADTLLVPRALLDGKSRRFV